MDAATKNRQDHSTLNKMIQRAFGNVGDITPEQITEMDGGFCNIVYLISLPDGREYVLKIAPPDDVLMMSYEIGLLETEVGVLNLVKEQTSIVAPEVVFYDNTREICSAPYFFMSKIEGESLVQKLDQLTPEEKLEIRKKLGNYTRQMNDIKGTEFGIFSNKESFAKTNEEFVLSLFAILLEDGKNKGSNLKHITYGAFWELLCENASVFHLEEKPSLVHWDLWDGNVFVKDGKLSGIIDFERAMWADPLMEHDFSGFSDPDPGFLEGYGKTEFTKEENIRRSFYLIYRMLVMIIECDYRNYEGDEQYQWVTGEFEKELEKLMKLLK